jgi:hypothetical protein
MLPLMPHPSNSTGLLVAVHLACNSRPPTNHRHQLCTITHPSRTTSATNHHQPPRTPATATNRRQDDRFRWNRLENLLREGSKSQDFDPTQLWLLAGWLLGPNAPKIREKVRGRLGRTARCARRRCTRRGGGGGGGGGGGTAGGGAGAWGGMLGVWLSRQGWEHLCQVPAVWPRGRGSVRRVERLCAAATLFR